MKAAILDKYDKQGRDLTIVEVPMPEIKADEVFVRVHTAAVNPLDNMIIRGEVKLIVPYTMPLVMGNEFCGTIEKMGGEVRGFSVGDRVYGRLPLNRIGAFAEYLAVRSDAIAKVPKVLVWQVLWRFHSALPSKTSPKGPSSPCPCVPRATARQSLSLSEA